MTVKLTEHAIYRACLRWLEPNVSEAARAIRHVLENGVAHTQHGCTVYQLGTRCVRVTDNTAVTVTVMGVKRVERMRVKARRDLKNRKH